jgi:hypothetical protein
MTVTGRSPQQEGLVLAFYHDFAHLGRSAKVQTVHGVYKRDGREICNFAGTVVGKTIGHRAVLLRLRLSGGRHRIHQVVVRNTLPLEGVHNWLSELRLMHWGLRITPANGDVVKIYENTPAQYQGRS